MKIQLLVDDFVEFEKCCNCTQLQSEYLCPNIRVDEDREDRLHPLFRHQDGLGRSSSRVYRARIRGTEGLNWSRYTPGRYRHVQESFFTNQQIHSDRVVTVGIATTLKRRVPFRFKYVQTLDPISEHTWIWGEHARGNCFSAIRSSSECGIAPAPFVPELSSFQEQHINSPLPRSLH